MEAIALIFVEAAFLRSPPPCTAHPLEEINHQQIL
jgi:hypothetical protein